MAVYTQLRDSDMDTLLRSHYQRRLLSASAIEAGTENTNYRVTTQTLDAPQTEKFVLTVFEHASEQELAPIIALTHTLADANISVPSCLTTVTGARFIQVNDKPAILTPFAQGTHPETPNLAQCADVARALATIHTTAFDQPLRAYDPIGTVQQLSQQLSNTLSDSDNALSHAVLDQCAAVKGALGALPTGVLHTDLFTDNALFTGDTLSALLDFYSAARGILLFDLAVLINDWCFETSDEAPQPHTRSRVTLNSDKVSTILDAYQELRPLHADEHALLPMALQLMACRFWLSRHALLQQHGVLSENKAPNAFKQRLLAHRA